MSSAPAFRQLADDLRGRIAAGELPPGSQLPSMTKLREQHNVSSTVVRDALNELRRDGLIVGRQGKGVFVADDVSAAARRPDDTQARLDRLEEAVRTLTERVDDLAAGRP
ncbi:winged helix-turn-helix domain-containing protein [Jiangella anatolica]|uniref:GntR family transcriptional regulator n=1 Tax=Jiangella anatolica TaxID=2670374 RepID=A0A2W2BZX0_9ACTN|nr:winged helix-turn-helix domain-containing protein [Jiangella anatolica]PZF81589.1 GntR family transcriptional regulator [Jiangella anatolica]